MQLSKYRSTLLNIMQLSKYGAALEGCLFFGNMYNDLRAVMGVAPGHALVMGKVQVKGKLTYSTLNNYYLSLELNYT